MGIFLSKHDGVWKTHIPIIDQQDQYISQTSSMERLLTKRQLFTVNYIDMIPIVSVIVEQEAKLLSPVSLEQKAQKRPASFRHEVLPLHTISGTKIKKDLVAKGAEFLSQPNDND